MDPYLRRLASMTRLDADAEHALAVLSWGGDVAARERLITASLPLVLMRARRLGLHGQRLLDAVQAGTIGLIEAIDRFDPSRGCRLSTYAWWWIGQAMSRTSPLPEFRGSIDGAPESDHLPELGKQLMAGLDPDLAEVLQARFGTGTVPGRSNSRREVAQALGMTVSQVRTKEAKALSHLRVGLAKVGPRASHQHRGAGPL